LFSVFARAGDPLWSTESDQSEDKCCRVEKIAVYHDKRLNKTKYVRERYEETRERGDETDVK
jgi:hypothetical protein